MGELRSEFRAAIRKAMSAPDEAAPFVFESAEDVMGRGTHYNVAELLHGVREKLTPEQTGAPEAVDLDVVYLVACYHLARCRHVPEERRTWDYHAMVFLFGVVHALRPDAVPQPLRDAFVQHPPRLVPPYEIVHAVGNALFLASVPADDRAGIALATALMVWARDEAQGGESEPAITFNLGTAMAALADCDGGDDPVRTRAAALHLMRQAIAVLPAGDPARQEMMAILMRTQATAPPAPVAEGSTAAEVTHYMRDGDPNRLDTLVDRLRRAVDRAATGEPERSHRRIELGQALRMRFEMEGELADLDGSITELTDALAGPLGDEERATAHSFLGLAHLDRYASSGDLADLEAATAAVRHPYPAHLAVSVTHAQRLTNLAAVLTARFDAYGDMAELSEAVDHLQYAVAATPPAQHDRPVMLIKLALALRKRGVRTGRDAEMDAAASILRQVAGEPSDTGPNHQLARRELGHLLEMRGRGRRAVADLVEAAAQYRTTALAPTQDIRTRLHCAALWGLTCETLADLEQARAAFGVALAELLPKLTGRALGRESQETRLREFSSLANVAAAVEITAGRPRQALVRLEQGRGVLLAQALQLRSRHDDLVAASPRLAARFEQVCAELVARQRSPEQRKASAAEFDRVVREIRALRGFGHFHRPPDWARLSEAAALGPVAVINISPLRCDALLLHHRSGRAAVEVLPLPGVTAEEINHRADAFQTAVATLATPGTTGGERYVHDRELKRTLRWLGDEIVRPVLERLGLDGPVAQGAPAPRLWWCPTGVLSLLPLHAALLEGDGRPGSVYAHDRVVSSYVPTLGSLLHARDTPAPDAGRTSLVAVAVDTGHAHPRLASLDEELSATAEWTGRRTALRDAEATPEAVLAALRTHTHAHFACHGVRDPADPSHSRLLLHGGHVTLRGLAAERLRDAELAYLSACHSAAPGQELADEVISVASAFQLCGYRQVVGSLWTVDDKTGPLLAREVYRLLSAPDAHSAAHALHRAVGTLREHPRYREPLFWASVIHSGP
ncbi:CHAT domain-containing protein [Streptomyces sp. TRM49041]|uniref:CHAT domain-containing protein n=1 Tax=Streptomyces sp. TRM49041 TaxID=2603216 RepID=UPI0011EFF68A|nr:CHAT domain-containing protein [Streptomyces sp. TRM49041]